jgi:transcriptional regulator with XRE-family HTH domain
MSDDREQLGLRLREAREYLELSQDEVSRALGIPRTAISLMEAGQRRVDALELKKLAEIYQRPVAFFTEELHTRTAPESVQHLARMVSKLTDKDRQELLRFAEFLQARGKK